MASGIDMKADMNAAGKAVHSVVVSIDNHETILRFASKEDVERFAQEERARMVLILPSCTAYAANSC
jgi:hypothetical protein